MNSGIPVLLKPSYVLNETKGQKGIGADREAAIETDEGGTGLEIETETEVETEAETGIETGTEDLSGIDREMEIDMDEARRSLGRS